MNDQQASRQIFTWPLFSQRYAWVREFLEANTHIKSITDFGCGNGRMVNWLKHVANLEIINCVDADNFLVEDYLHHYFMPGFCEVLFGRQNSDKELTINVYNADLTIPNDLLRSDCMSLVEVIEHLHPEEVEKAVRSVFGYYAPEFVIVTTPNREFNCLLRAEGESVDTFRHQDHKFEWTREEFNQWANAICSRYPYSVQFDGVGHLPGSEPYGPCTQIAIFKRHPNSTTTLNDNAFESFDLVFDRLDMADNNSVWGYSKVKRSAVLKAEYKIPGRTRPAEPEPAVNWSAWYEQQTNAGNG